MPAGKIQDLEGLLKQYTGENKKIIDVKQENLTAPGENYCSLMLKLDITLKNLENGQEEELHAVAKTINTEVNDFFKAAAPSQFKKEIAFYTEIVPTLQEFQREQGVTEVLDLFPKLYAARKNLHGNDDEVDDDAVLILENLKEQGYSLIDRVVGFDLDGAKLLLKDLAQLHAVPIALKLTKSKMFEDKVKKNCLIDALQVPPRQGDTRKPPEWLRDVATNAKTKQYFNNLVNILSRTNRFNFFTREHAEPFSTFAHSDMWVNNTMQIQKDDTLVKNRFLDFQLYQYGSAICDVIFFIFASCQNYVSGDHLDEILQYYHTHFIDTLEKLGCDLKPFEYAKFLDRVNVEAPGELLHTLFLVVTILVKQGEQSLDVQGIQIERQGAVTDKALEKILHVVCEYGKRGWIK